VDVGRKVCGQRILVEVDTDYADQLVTGVRAFLYGYVAPV
jgi:hypothetical protein